MPRTAFFRADNFLSIPVRSTPRKTAARSAPTDGREHVIFESVVAFLALLLIITGFSLYVDRAFADTAMPAGTIQTETQSPAEPPLSPVEA